MIPASFEYFAPRTIKEALTLLSQHGDAKILSGGHSLLPVIKLRLAEPKVVIDIGRIPGLSGIREEGGMISIGALTTHYAIESSGWLKEKCSLLGECASQIGDVQVRNRGTIGGSCVHADPAADYPAAMLALDAVMVAEGPRGRREIAAENFFIDMLTSAVGPQEILVEIRLPLLTGRTGFAYRKVKQSASGFAICGVAVALQTEGNHTCRRISVGVTGVAAKAYRAAVVESMLLGKPLGESVIRAASAHAADHIETLGDIHASAEYRKHLAAIYCARAIQAAYQRL
ncbi:MAG: xanthine dehydrogenase family protein subunit M [Terriglobia bacterium]